MEGMIGEIRLFAGNFAPKTWAFCQGQIIAIASNTALFSILGTTYGGDGRVNFGLPDLRGKTALGPRQGPGLPSYSLGEKIGEATHTLTVNEMAAHNHTAVAMASANGPNATQPSGKYLGKGGRSTPLENIYTTASTPAATMGVTGTVISPAGGNLAHNNMQPFLAMNYIICMQGIFPVRN